ncbi:MAG: alpha-E domain-containing protein [Chloroflexota bacterium]|nr:alpha-E domain-containing protein [Chloroflexota bacterium]
MLSRVADDLYWVARYVERGIAVARLVDVTRHLELDAGTEDFWAPLVGAIDLASEDVRFYLTSDTMNPDSLVSCVRAARTLARGVREAMSSEMWEELNTLHGSLATPTTSRQVRGEAVSFARLVRERLQAFQGLGESTLAREEEWQFLELGKFVERADGVARVLNRQSHLLAAGQGSDPTGPDVVRWLAVLRTCGSAEAYARYYSLRVEPARLVEFLLLNPVFPQSVRFSLVSACAALDAVGTLRSAAGNDPGPAARTLGRARAQVELTAIDEVFERGLESFLTHIQQLIAQASDELSATYLRDQPQPGRLVGVARATQIMAAQQQQQ